LLHVNIDLSDLLDIADIQEGVQREANRAAEELAAMTKHHIEELAAEKLHSRREAYVDKLTLSEEDGVHMVVLDASVRWIEDGQPAWDMLPSLLASKNAKTAKDGSQYAIVNFAHGGPSQGRAGGAKLGPATNSPIQQDLVATIQSAMRDKKIPWGKIEKDANGEARLGRLHNFSIMTKPVKTQESPGMGRGPLGQVRQGNTGIPFLQDVSVHQFKDNNGKVQRSISTFRIASSKHKGTGKWLHPGSKPMYLFEEAAAWAQDMWEKEIGPKLMAKILAR
jgi:hypothetical protein